MTHIQKLVEQKKNCRKPNKLLKIFMVYHLVGKHEAGSFPICLFYFLCSWLLTYYSLFPEDLKKDGVGAAPEDVSIKIFILNVKDPKSEAKLSANKSAKKVFTY